MHLTNETEPRIIASLGRFACSLNYNNSRLANVLDLDRLFDSSMCLLLSNLCCVGGGNERASDITL